MRFTARSKASAITGIAIHSNWGLQMKVIFVAIVGLIGLAGPAAAQAPVAVVEDVQGKVTGAEFMDYVAPGKVIKLGTAAWSCLVT